MLAPKERKSCLDLSTNIEDNSQNLQIPKQEPRRHSCISFEVNNGQHTFEIAERRPTIISVLSNLSRSDRMERRNSRSSVTTREFKQGALVFIIFIFVIFMIFYHFIDYNSEMPDKKKNIVEVSLKQLSIQINVIKQVL